MATRLKLITIASELSAKLIVQDETVLY